MSSGPALFATIYNMRYAELNLILAMLAGLSIPALARLRAPWTADIIKPVQVWTDATLLIAEIDRYRRNVRTIAHPSIPTDTELARLVATLRDNGVSVLKTGITPPLQGFHYFGLEVFTEGAILGRSTSFSPNVAVIRCTAPMLLGSKKLAADHPRKH